MVHTTSGRSQVKGWPRLQLLHDQTMCKANENLNDCSVVGGGLTVNGNGDGQTLTIPNGGQTERGAESIQMGTNKRGGHAGPSTDNGKTSQKTDAMQAAISQTRD